MSRPPFDVRFDFEPDLQLPEGGRVDVQFTVANISDDFRNVCFRLAVMNHFGQEDPAAAERAWFTVAAPPEPLLQAGASMSCPVSIQVPAETSPHRIVWALAAWDKDQGDGSRAFSQPLSLDVPRDAPGAAGLFPWWVWLVAGLGAVAIAVTAVLLSGSGA